MKYVYLLQSVRAPRRRYVGVTSDLRARLTRISHRLSSRSGGEGRGWEACDRGPRRRLGVARLCRGEARRRTSQVLRGGRRSVTKQARSWRPMQQIVGEKCGLTKHNGGDCRHTSKYRPWKTVVSVGFDEEARALEFERYLKSGSGRAFALRHFW